MRSWPEQGQLVVDSPQECWLDLGIDAASRNGPKRRPDCAGRTNLIGHGWFPCAWRGIPHPVHCKHPRWGVRGPLGLSGHLVARRTPSQHRHGQPKPQLVAQALLYR